MSKGTCEEEKLPCRNIPQVLKFTTICYEPFELLHEYRTKILSKLALVRQIKQTSTTAALVVHKAE